MQMIIPQVTYAPDPSGAVEPYAILFATATGAGISLGRAFLDVGQDLVNKNQLAFAAELGVKAKVSLRIHVRESMQLSN